MSSARTNGGNRDRNGHVLVWEQPGLEEADRPLQKQAALVGARHIVTFMLFLGMANAYVMRTNMSVAIVAMVNHSALPVSETVLDDECPGTYNASSSSSSDGEFIWTTVEQSYILSSFFYGYVLTQIPFGILTKKYGAKYFLGIGMLINSVFGLLVPVAARTGYGWLILVRFIQGLGETYGIVVHTSPTPVFFSSIVFAWNGLSLLQGPIVPCTHALLAKWIPPNERSRMGAFVYAGAQFGTVVSMPLSGLLAALEFDGGWPLVFYVFGAVGTIWAIAYFFTVFEDPENHPSIAEDEKKYIISSVWGSAGVTSPPVPWKSIVRSLPFWAILIAHMGQNYGYETLMTELPTFMKQVLYFDIKSNGTVSALPYLAMWLFSMLVSHVADWMITSGRFTHTTTRKVLNSIGQFGPAICLAIASFTGCNKWLTVGVIVVGVGLNGGIYSGFKVNHLDISPRFAGILMSFTNCLANLAGLLAPMTAGYIIEGKPTQAQWRIVFMICVAVYVVCATFYLFFASGQRQPWDNPDIVDEKSQKKDVECAQQTTALNETQH